MVNEIWELGLSRSFYISHDASAGWQPAVLTFRGRFSQYVFDVRTIDTTGPVDGFASSQVLLVHFRAVVDQDLHNLDVAADDRINQSRLPGLSVMKVRIRAGLQ